MLCHCENVSYGPTSGKIAIKSKLFDQSIEQTIRGHALIGDWGLIKSAMLHKMMLHGFQCMHNDVQKECRYWTFYIDIGEWLGT